MKKLLLIPIFLLLLVSFVSATNLTYSTTYRVYEYNFYDQYASSVTSIDYRLDINRFMIGADYLHGTNRHYDSSGLSGNAYQTNANNGLVAKKSVNADVSDFYTDFVNRIIINQNDELAYYTDDGTFSQKCNWGTASVGTYDDITIGNQNGNDYLFILNSDAGTIQKATINVSTCSLNIVGAYVLPLVEGTDFTYYNKTFYVLNTDLDKVYVVDTNSQLRNTYEHEYLENATSITSTGTELLFGLSESALISSQYIVLSYVQPTSPLVEEIPYIYLEGDWYSKTQCIYDNYNNQWFLCEDSDFIVEDGEVMPVCYFNLDENLTTCGTGGCDTTYTYDSYWNVEYQSGECAYQSCFEDSNTCSFNGQTRCVNSQTQQTCGYYDADPCLDWSPLTTCLPNQICGADYKCKDINFTEYGTLISYPDFFVHTIIEDDVNINYKILNADKLQVETNYLLHTQDYNIVTNPPNIDIYGNVDCDYHELVYLDHTFDSGDGLPSFVNGTNLNIETSDNTGLEVLKIESDATFQSDVIAGLLIVDLHLIQKDFNKNSQISITYGGEIYNYLTIIIQHNKDANTFTYYKESVSPENLLFTSDAYIGSDKITSLKDMEIKSTFNVNDGLVDVNVILQYDDEVTEYQQVIQTTPFYSEDSETNYLDRITILATEHWLMSHFKVYKPQELPLILNPENYENNLECSYTNVGCYNVRIYGLGDDLPLYNNYVDKEICVNSLGEDENSIITEPKQQSIDELLNQMKNMSLVSQLLILVLSIGLTWFIFFRVGESDNTKKGIGLLVISLEVLVFTLIGVIPIWFIVLIMILVAMVTTSIFQRVFFGGN